MSSRLIRNVISQFYAMSCSFVALPLIFNKLGVTDYYYIALLNVYLGIIVLLDLGLTPTIIKYTSKKIILNNFVSKIISIGLIVSLLTFLFIYIYNYFYNNFESYILLFLFCFIISSRIYLTLIKGYIIGLGELDTVSKSNFIFNSLRYYLPLSLLFIKEELIIFFVVYFVTIFAEYIYYIKKIPNKIKFNISISKKDLKLLTFSGKILFLSLSWVGINYIDKLLLSNSVSKEVFSQYSIIILLSSFYIVISGPIGNYLIPKINKISVTKTRNITFYDFYNKIFYLNIFLSSLTLLFIKYFYEVLTMFLNVTLFFKEILLINIFANSFFILNNFSYYHQFVSNKLKYHMWLNAIFLLLFFPFLLYFAFHGNILYMSYVWFSLNLFWSIYNLYYFRYIQLYNVFNLDFFGKSIYLIIGFLCILF